jgi:hypothetical protein
MNIRGVMKTITVDYTSDAALADKAELEAHVEVELLADGAGGDEPVAEEWKIYRVLEARDGGRRYQEGYIEIAYKAHICKAGRP